MRRCQVILIVGAATVVACAMPGSAEARAAGLRVGCARSRPAVAFRVGGRRLWRQPATRHVPCLEVINQRTSESADVDVLPNGTVLYAPLVPNTYPPPLDDRGPAEIAASADGGLHWRTVVPGDQNHILDVPPWMSVDAHTHRIWFATVLPPLCGAEISWSDDGGRQWQTNPAVGCPAMGSEAVLEGLPPRGGAKPTGYPHVVYYCANANDLSASTLWCYRSLDGGSSFTLTGSFPDPPPSAGCQTEHPARPGAVGTEGYLYFPVFRCGQLAMAISRDEGASWHRVPIGRYNVADLYTTSVSVDPAGNIYLAWIEGTGSGSGPSSGGGPNPRTEGIQGSGMPFLSISRDHGRHWSKPVSIAPPGVKDAAMIAIASHGIGQLAVSYLANTNGRPLVDGWLSESRDALRSHAVWWAAPLNDPATPLIDTRTSTTFGNRLFFNTDNFSAQGVPWAAFHCAFTAACPNERIGVVGRLAEAGGPHGPVWTRGGHRRGRARAHHHRRGRARAHRRGQGRAKSRRPTHRRSRGFTG